MSRRRARPRARRPPLPRRAVYSCAISTSVSSLSRVGYGLVVTFGSDGGRWAGTSVVRPFGDKLRSGLVEVPAGCPAGGRDLQERRVFGVAVVVGERAPGAEGTADGPRAPGFVGGLGFPPPGGASAAGPRSTDPPG